MATRVVPNDWRAHIGYDLILDISSTPENTYYMFLGKHMPTSGVEQIFDDTHDLLIDAYRNMICAKRITQNDAAMMIRNIPWVIGTPYAMYDDSDTTTATDDYYAVVNAGAFYHIWKCLDNNFGANSTVAPDIAQINIDDTYYRTSDGYMWKYMASTPVAMVNKFATDAYFPIVANSQVTDAAVPGAIDVILIANTGSGYRNWLTGSFSAADCRVNGNSIIYSVTGNTSSSIVNGFYTGCNLYIVGGAGIGQYKIIDDYFSNANGNFIIIDSPFFDPPQNGSTYQIYPSVTISGDGSQTINAAARALVNAVGNTIYHIDMLNRGAGYNYIKASVVANQAAAPTYPAIIRGIYGPYDGHGYNSYEELGATRVALSITFANTEANTIPATNIYQQVGILKRPLFQNVVLNFTEMKGTFIGQETIYSYSTRLLQNNVSLTTGSANVTVSNGILSQQLRTGDSVVFSATDNTAFWYTTVNAISNDTFMTITNPPSAWACTAAQLSLAILGTGTGVVSSLPGGNTIAISNVTGDFPTSSYVIGVNSGARGQINNISRNDVLKNFNTFIALNKLVATSVSGTFQENEVLYMNPTVSNVSSAQSTAYIHSVKNNAGTLTFLVSNTVGTFADDLTGTVFGANSGAVATLTTKYTSEIVFGSSKVLYLENIAPVQRSANTSDTINIILEF